MYEPLSYLEKVAPSTPFPPPFPTSLQVPSVCLGLINTGWTICHLQRTESSVLLHVVVRNSGCKPGNSYYTSPPLSHP